MKLSETLLSFANWNARKALENWHFNDDLHLRLETAVCAGMAAELLLKHLLARYSPGLLAELVPIDKAKALFARTTFSSDDYSAVLADVRSCTAGEAHYIHTQVNEIPTVIGLTEFQQIMQVRNAACHLAAITTQAALRDAIYALVSMYEQTKVEVPDLEWPFTGMDDEIDSFKDEYRQFSQKAIKEKLAEHEASFRSGTQSIHATDPLEFLQFWTDKIFFEEESFTRPAREQHKCPVCKSQDGQLLCESEGELFDNPDDPDEAVYGEMLHPMAFACMNCELCLSPRELRTLASGGDGWATNATRSLERHSGTFTKLPEDLRYENA